MNTINYTQITIDLKKKLTMDDYFVLFSRSLEIHRASVISYEQKYWGIGGIIVH